MSSSSGLYDDLEGLEVNAELKIVQEKLREANQQNIILQEHVNDLTQQINVLLSDRNNLEKNIVAVFNTAKSEMERKDREIMDLRRICMQTGNKRNA